MAAPDLNLLVTLDVLLAEGSVARAARRLRLSPSAMSRALARLREATGDPLLVRAGRGLVPTRRAVALRDQVGQLVQDVRAVLRPAEALNLDHLARTFVVRSSEGFVENFGAALVTRIGREAPGVRLCFVGKADRDGAALRDGSVDLEAGVVGPAMGPEMRVQALYRDRFVGVVRRGHSLSRGRVTPARFAAGRHILVSRQASAARGPIDEALAGLGLRREIVALVGGFAAAIALARGADLVVSVPARHTAALRDGMHSFPLPFPVPEITVSQIWHPRQDGDAAHRWLRSCVREVCGGAQGTAKGEELLNQSVEGL